MPGLAVEVIDIDDPQDPRVEDFRDLNSVDRRPDLPVLPGGRPGRGLVIAEGVLVAQRMIASRFSAHAFLGVDKRMKELDDDLRDPSLSGVPFFRASAEVMAEIVGFHLNRGVLAVSRRPEVLSVPDIVETARTVAILEGVNDHENIGSIFRNAAGLGVDAVLFGQGCADPLYRRCVRVSMGHALLVPFAKFDEWPRGLDELRSRDFRLVSMTPDPDAVTLAEAVDAEKIGFLVGAEGPGLTASAMASTDVKARIPMSRGTDSLNVATAAAVAFYERVRSGTMGE
ncbi:MULTISPECIES: TrmH family RNA methyltransferase [Gordonia]|uniref:RNA methyltransferase n=1 Tax=Gordonia amicalis TaxID=89053 RepID=A0ABU4DBC9_9ACTN|nr:MULTISPECIES: RNA methyltransferase [Gordonia]ATD69896.1 RNA methyltransferase [Gordonia sp. 1D]MBA5848342.1 RNA methyltransferase [Gordonia amicalis]MDV6307042.1 RNA methyltransferase [Gordonia amicalis]NKX78222.1 RNA methyltransferase [Gordonia amicalis]GAC53012.1 putative RNA methyltransferase [Gordonia amicalis NBRC 100051 = JCM 11271]